MKGEALGAASRSIRVLPPEVAERIAAGEVIERPASVVKELVENALDAGARRVTVEAEGGGVGLLRVSDDGEGIGWDDAGQLFRRHATSKLRSEADLAGLATLGFRGEALASIAAVAEIEIQTRRAGDATGALVTPDPGGGARRERAARAPGTTVTVRRLFNRLPVRERFLRAEREELAELTRAVTRYALACPAVAFRLVRDGRETMNLPAEEDERARWRAVWGEDAGRELAPVAFEFGTVRVRGAVSTPAHTRGAAQDLVFFVNGRWVADRGLAGALLAAYHGLLEPRRYPRAVLHVELPAGEVDANVHPAKREVRFAHPDRVRDAVRRGAARALAGHFDPVTAREAGDPRRLMGRPSSGAVAGRERAAPWPAGAAREVSGSMPFAFEDRGAPELAAAPERAAADMGFPRQIAGTFIVDAGGDGLLLYDQHAAHERVLYEDALRRLDARQGEAQELLIPATVELTADEASALDDARPALEALGYGIQPFGARTVAITSYPSCLRRWDGGEGLRRMLAAKDDAGPAEGEGAPARERVASLFACRHAIKAGDAMTREEMHALVAALRRAADPHRCPHGRPTMIHIGAEELRRRFRRT